MKSNHLLEPLTSTPINGTKIKKKRQTRNNIIEIFNKLSFSIDEKKKNKENSYKYI